jgi:hypothetical protein
VNESSQPAEGNEVGDILFDENGVDLYPVVVGDAVQPVSGGVASPASLLASQGNQGNAWPDGSTSALDARNKWYERTAAASERLKDRLNSKDLEDIHVQGLAVRMKAGQRWAHQAYQKYRLAEGTAGGLADKVSRAVGGSIALAREAIDLHRSAQRASDPAVLLEEAEGYLVRRYTENPSLAYRSQLRKLLIDLDGGAVHVIEGSARVVDADEADGGLPGGGISSK